MTELKREDLIAQLTELCGLENNKLSWAKLCKMTNFDSFTTAFCFGIKWQDENLETMPIEHLRMAVFNIKTFPKEQSHD